MKKYYSLKSFLVYLGQFKFWLIVIFSLFSLSCASLAVVPVFIGKLIGTLSSQPVNYHVAWLYVGALLGCNVFHNYSWHGAELLYVKYLNPLPYKYETEIARFVLLKPYPFFVGKFTGKIASYITLIGKETNQFLSRIMYNYTEGVVKLVSITAILFSVNITTGSIFIAGIVVMFIVGRYSIKNSVKYESTFTDVESSKNGKIIDIMSNFVNIKSYNKEAQEWAGLTHEQAGVIAASKKSYHWGIFFWTTMSFIVRLIIWPATVVLNVYYYKNGVINLAQLTTLLSTIMLFSGQVWEFIWYISQFNLTMSRIEEAHRYLFGKNVVYALKAPTQAPSFKPVTFTKTLELSDLHFAYPDQPDLPVLQNIRLTIHKGEKIGVVGKSGSGKTTFVKILLGYYDIPTESIVLDGVPVKNNQLTDIISYVPQDATLFNRSIADNIAYAASGKTTKQQVIQVSKHALADEFIKRIPDKYDAVVGERGVKLSTGQRQRIAIARAMLQGKPLLILDEATSALDSENEVLVQRSLENLWNEHTVISIAHRLSTLRKMDRIVVFDDGQIIEVGSIEELLTKKGAFYELWNHQVNGMIID